MGFGGLFGFGDKRGLGGAQSTNPFPLRSSASLRLCVNNPLCVPHSFANSPISLPLRALDKIA